MHALQSHTLTIINLNPMPVGIQEFANGLRRLGQRLDEPAEHQPAELMAELQAAGMAQRSMFKHLDKPQMAAWQLMFMHMPELNSQKHDSATALLQVHEDMLVNGLTVKPSLHPLCTSAPRS